MSNKKIIPRSLVLYKIRPAIVTSIADKLEIALEGGKSKRVREKDVKLLHPGPVSSLGDLQPGEGNVEEAWELLEGEQATIAELAELVYGEYTPASAWGVRELLVDGLYFEGSPSSIRPRSAKAVEQTLTERQAKEAEAKAWTDFLQRVQQGAIEEQDRKRLAEVERVALKQQDKSKILQALEIKATPEAAHGFLIKCGYWPLEFNPWPLRQGASLDSPDLPVPAMEQTERVDLTHLPAYAIDDVGNTDPDDAISIDGDKLWVHIADVAGLVAPDSHLDLAARERSANLYLPEGTATMLPHAVTEQLGLGLQAQSPALSIGFRLVDDEVTDIEIVLSNIQVTRLSYDEVDGRMDEPEFAAIDKITDQYRILRMARDAAQINLPEVSVRVIDGEISIRSLPKLKSRQMVTDAMLMAGEAVARFAMQHEISIPFAVQPPPEEIRQPQSMSEAHAYRRLFKPSNASLTPDRHFGLGLDYYARATSPLRRYVDLVLHQQIRAFVLGKTPMSRTQVSERVAAASAVGGLIRRSERLSNQHWKQVYLLRQEQWQGEAVIVALEERKVAIIIPELALETKIRRKDDMQLDQILQLKLREVDIPGQTVYFHVG